MKYLNNTILVFVFLALSVGLKAQDSTKIKIGDKTIIIVEPGGDTSVTKDMEFEDYIDSVVSDGMDADDIECEDKGDKEIAHWGGFEMGVSGLLNADGGLELNNSLYDLDYSKSLVFNLNLFETKAEFFGGYAGLITGLGFNWNNYAFKGNTQLSANNDSTWASSFEGPTFSKNKLRAVYIKVPLLLEFNTSLIESKTFHVAAGLEGGFRIRSKTKQQYEFEGEEYKINTLGHYNLNPWKLSAVGRIGYKKFTLFANYGLTSLFEDGKGPEMYPFEVGITVVGF